MVKGARIPQFCRRIRERRESRKRFPHLGIAALIAAAPASRLAAQKPDSATFYLLLRTDTILVERQARTADHLSGEFVDRLRGAHLTFDASLAPEGLVTQLTIVSQARGAAAATTVISIRGDSLALTARDQTTMLPAPRGGVPYINPSPSFFEQLAVRARAVGTSPVTVPLIAPGIPPVNAVVTWSGPDSTQISVSGTIIKLATTSSGKLLGGQIPSQGVRIVRGAPVAPLVVQARDYSAPEGAPYSAADVTFTTPGGIKLGGTLTLPKNARGRVPAVVTLTGSGQQERDESLPGITGYKPFRQIADTLGRRGIAVLRIDDRGVGESGGNPATETSADYAADIGAAVDYLRGRHDIDPTRIGLIGHSEGGMVAPMVADKDHAIKGIVLLAGPSRTGRRILEYQLGRQIELAPVSDSARAAMRKRLPAMLDSMASNPWSRYFMSYDPAPTARRVHTPVLILQGGRDIQLTPDQAGELAADFRAGGNKHVTVRVFPLLNHLFLLDEKGNTDYAALPSKRVPPEVLGAIADWFVANLR